MIIATVILVLIPLLMLGAGLFTVFIMGISGVRVSDFKIGVGPQLIEFQLGQTKIQLRLFYFFNVVVVFETLLSGDHEPPQLGHPPQPIDGKPGIVRSLIGLSVMLFYAAVAFGLLGTEAGREILEGVRQILSGAFSPAGRGKSLVESLNSLFQTEGLRIGLGMVAAKGASASFFNGFWVGLFLLFYPPSRYPKAVSFLLVGLAVLWMIIMGLWAMAIGFWVLDQF